jgi:hypothetical protein
MRVPAKTAPDLAVLMEVLDLSEFHPTWTSPIALLVPCAGAHSFLSDASYGGPNSLSHGALSVSVIFLLISMKAIDFAREPADLIQEGLHINPPEFMAIIVNLWLAFKLIAK